MQATRPALNVGDKHKDDSCRSHLMHRLMSNDYTLPATNQLSKPRRYRCMAFVKKQCFQLPRLSFRRLHPSQTRVGGNACRMPNARRRSHFLAHQLSKIPQDIPTMHLRNRVEFPSHARDFTQKARLKLRWRGVSLTFVAANSLRLQMRHTRWTLWSGCRPLYR